MPTTKVRYNIPGTEEYVEVSVDYDVTTTFGEIKPMVYNAINQELITRGYPGLAERRRGKLIEMPRTNNRQ